MASSRSTRDGLSVTKSPPPQTRGSSTATWSNYGTRCFKPDAGAGTQLEIIHPAEEEIYAFPTATAILHKSAVCQAGTCVEASHAFDRAETGECSSLFNPCPDSEEPLSLGEIAIHKRDLDPDAEQEWYCDAMGLRSLPLTGRAFKNAVVCDAKTGMWDRDPNKEIVSGFPSQFTKHYFVAAYLYANKSAKDAPVALIETYVFMFSVSLCSSRL